MRRLKELKLKFSGNMAQFVVFEMICRIYFILFSNMLFACVCVCVCVCVIFSNLSPIAIFSPNIFSPTLGFAVFAVILCAGATILKSDQAISVAKHVDCERQCPYYYFPICATNGNPKENRMFVNICEMHAWNCDTTKSK